MDKDVMQVQIYFKTAEEVEAGNPVTAHYIRAYAINKAVEVYKTKQISGQDISEIKKNLDIWFKDTEFKKQLINPALLSDKAKNQKDFLNFVLLLFKEADDQYRDETYTAQTALSFHRCSMLFDAYSIFGELDDDTKNKRKYAKLKMLEIRKNIQNGFVPKKREEISIEQMEKNLISYGNNEENKGSDVRTSMMSNNFTTVNYSGNNYPQNANQFNSVNQSTRIESTGISGNPYGNQGGYPGSMPFGGAQQSQNIKQSQNIQPKYNADDNLFDPKHQDTGHNNTNVYQSSIQGSKGDHPSNTNPYQSSFNAYNTPTVPTTHTTTQITPDNKAPSHHTTTNTTSNTLPTFTTVQVPSGNSASFVQPPTANIQTKVQVPLAQSDLAGNQTGRTTGRSTAARRDPEYLKRCQDAKSQLQKGISELDYRRVPQAIENVKAALLVLQELMDQ